MCNLSDVLAIEDPERLLQGLDLFLPACHAILVTYASIYAGRFQLFIVRKCGIELLLCAIEVSLLLLEGLLLILLLARLVLDVLCLLCLVDRRITHKLVILLLSFCLGGAGFRLETCKVGLDHFDHANHTAILRTHTLVGLVKNLWLLNK